MPAGTDARQTKMTADLGGEQVLLERIEAVEILGAPFTLAVDVIATLGEIDLMPHLGKPVSVKVFEDDVVLRDFHGLTAEAAYLKESSSGFHYRLTLRPFTFFLSQNRDMAIFQDKSALDIIKKVFADANASDVDYTRLSRSFPVRKYCVQYRESDFGFITRLMEEEGLYYFFRHTKDKHTLVLCDAPNAHEAGTPGTLVFNATSTSVFNVDSQSRSDQSRQYIQRFVERVSTGAQAKVTLRDFDFEKPQRPLHAVHTNEGKHPHDDREIYQYPGGYIEESHGGDLGKTRLEALRHDRQIYTGESQAAGLTCGAKVAIADHPASRLNGDFLITRTYHSIVSESYRTGGADNENPFNIQFEAIPAKTPFQLPVSTPKPHVSGLETAIVSGPDGEEIFTDEYGRVKVRFHWDRSGTAGEKSTCWIRVAQFGGLGSLILPRVGQEVMVDFLHGDPDSPIVMGWVFNKTLMPIYDLPANKTRALWRTKRYGDTGQYPKAKSLDTGAPGANELRFEDKGGHEEVFLHAERDMNTRIRFQETHFVGQDQTVNIGHDRKDDVGNDETMTVGGNQKLTVTGNQTDEVDATRKVTVKADDSLKVGQSLKIEAGTTIEISANTSIELKVGANSIKIEASGITMKGMMVDVTAQADANLSGLQTTVKGTAMTTIQGALVKIN